MCWNWELLVHICAECFQLNRGDSTDKSDEGPFILLIVPCCHPTIRILWIIGVSCFLVHTFLWISNSLRTRNNQNTIYQLISLTNYSVIHYPYRKFKAEQTFKYCPILEKATVCCLFLKDYQWTLCWAISLHSTSPHFAYLRCSLILLSNLRLDICGLIFSAVTTKIFYLGPISFCTYICVPLNLSSYFLDQNKIFWAQSSKALNQCYPLWVNQRTADSYKSTLCVTVQINCKSNLNLIHSFNIIIYVISSCIFRLKITNFIFF